MMWTYLGDELAEELVTIQQIPDLLSTDLSIMWL